MSCEQVRFLYHILALVPMPESHNTQMILNGILTSGVKGYVWPGDATRNSGGIHKAAPRDLLFRMLPRPPFEVLKLRRTLHVGLYEIPVGNCADPGFIVVFSKSDSQWHAGKRAFRKLVILDASQVHQIVE